MIRDRTMQTVSLRCLRSEQFPNTAKQLQLEALRSPGGIILT